jgi:hypothetical protein
MGDFIILPLYGVIDLKKGRAKTEDKPPEKSFMDQIIY